MSKTSKRGVKRKRSKGDRSVGLTSLPDDEELQHLEEMVLGRGADVFKNPPSGEDEDDEISFKEEKREKVERKPAWVDEDDNITYREVLQKKGKRGLSKCVTATRDYNSVMKSKFEQIMGVPKWAKFKKHEDPEENLLNSCGNFLKKSKSLESGLLEFKKLRHLNFQTLVEGPYIRVVKFHPKATIAMVAGVSGMVSLFQVDGKENPKLQTLKFQNFPIYCGAFLRNGEEFLIGSPHYRFFFCHDLMTGKSNRIHNAKLADVTKTKKFVVSPNEEFIALCGNSGKIFLIAAQTKEFIDTLQMNCIVTALNFSYDGSFLYSHGEDGEVYIWDMKSRTCVKKFYDDGCLTGTSISVSLNDQFIACGSSSGVVNIYDRENVHSEGVPYPTKTVYNLVTAVTSTQFNSSGEILALASKDKRNALKLLHCPSMSVFSNFPSFKSSISRPFCMDFSPNGGFFAVGDNNGKAHLYRLKHYGNY